MHLSKYYSGLDCSLFTIYEPIGPSMFCFPHQFTPCCEVRLKQHFASNFPALSKNTVPLLLPLPLPLSPPSPSPSLSTHPHPQDLFFFSLTHLAKMPGLDLSPNAPRKAAPIPTTSDNPHNLPPHLKALEAECPIRAPEPAKQKRQKWVYPPLATQLALQDAAELATISQSSSGKPSSLPSHQLPNP